MHKSLIDYITSLEDSSLTVLSKNNGSTIEEVFYDTRMISHSPNGLFIALQTQLNDGNKYIEEAFQKGVRNFLVSDGAKVSPEITKLSTVISCTDTLRIFQAIAKIHRAQFNYPVIAITGSNGKTIVKEWLYTLLKKEFDVVRSPQSFNSQLGVPYSLWQMSSVNNLAIIEAGISKSGEMDSLASIINPTLGIITTLTDAHNSGFSNSEEKLKEKLKLFAHCKAVIYPDWNKEIKKGIKKYLPTSVKLIKAQKDSFLEKEYPKNNIFIENASLCKTVLDYLQVDKSIFYHTLPLLETLPMRLEVLEGTDNCTLINDSYSGDMKSLELAIQFMKQQNHKKDKLLILGAFEDNELEKHTEQLLTLTKGLKVWIIGGGKELSNSQLSAHFQSFANTGDLISYLKEYPPHNQVILLKGARKWKLEQVASLLTLKKHQTVLEIHLPSLVHNYKILKSHLSPSTKVMGVVKAFGYGSGSIEVAKSLQSVGIDYLAVAYADEGVALRIEQIRTPIMVMNAYPNSFDSLLKYNLEPEIYSLRQLDAFISYLIGQSFKEPVGIHLKFDTGMNRLGFKLSEIEAVVKRIKHNKQINVISILSHLSAADEPEWDEYTISQIKSFNQICQHIQTEIGYNPIRHILNTAGINRFSDWASDMVRCGIGLYGISFGSDVDKEMQSVVRFKSFISQIKKIPKGESIGYGKNAIVKTPKRIAVIEVGYADGVRRILSNGKYSFTINGKKAPIIGNICMDMTMVDVTKIEANEGDEVIIFNSVQDIIQMANASGTIPYEVLSGISNRVKRVYIKD